MTLLITVFAAVTSTLVWYFNKQRSKYKLSVLCFTYWGAAIMWLVDAIFEFVELKADYFTPAVGDMVNDAFLGLSVAALGLIIWLVVLLVSDPDGVIRKRKQN